MKLAVVLFNLGGPSSLDEVEPFLRNLFSDPAILAVPDFLRAPLARILARRRTPLARDIYAKLGGGSPILRETQSQAKALETELRRRSADARTFIAMRASSPGSNAAAAEVKAWNPDQVVLLPLYPQFSTTTSASSFNAWKEAANTVGLHVPTARICCYPWDRGFVAAMLRLCREALKKRKPGISYRILFSAHGLPKYVAARGDPYAWQVQQTVSALVDRLETAAGDWRLCFQSRVGPLKWLEPATDAEIRRAGREGRGIIVVPVAFVSEHSETLVELDVEYARLAAASGVPDYIRVPTVSADEEFIEGLAELVMRATANSEAVTCGEGRICPPSASRCGYSWGM